MGVGVRARICIQITTLPFTVSSTTPSLTDITKIRSNYLTSASYEAFHLNHWIHTEDAFLKGLSYHLYLVTSQHLQNLSSNLFLSFRINLATFTRVKLHRTDNKTNKNIILKLKEKAYVSDTCSFCTVTLPQHSLFMFGPREKNPAL